MTDGTGIEETLHRIIRDVGRGATDVILSEWDSMDKVRLFLAVEEAFSIRLGLTEIRGVRCIADLSALVKSKLQMK